MPGPRSGSSKRSADQVNFAALRKQGACAPSSARLRLASDGVDARSGGTGKCHHYLNSVSQLARIIRCDTSQILRYLAV